MADITIAIDGYSSCGKSTVAKSLAQTLGYIHVDSGAMYRAISLHAIRNGWVSDQGMDRDSIINSLSSVEISFAKRKHAMGSDMVLNGENVEAEIREMKVSEQVSKVSVIPEVRKFMQEIQHGLGAKGGVVMDGRDIGTAVFPNAELKIFMTATPEVRAQRRFDELKAKGKDVSIEEIRANLEARDHEDTTRKENPLVQADDALVLDNSDLTLEGQLQIAVGWAKERIS